MLVCVSFPVIPLCGILVSKLGNHLAVLQGGCAILEDTETLFRSEFLLSPFICPQNTLGWASALKILFIAHAGSLLVSIKSGVSARMSGSPMKRR